MTPKRFEQLVAVRTNGKLVTDIAAQHADIDIQWADGTTGSCKWEPMAAQTNRWAVELELGDGVTWIPGNHKKCQADFVIRGRPTKDGIEALCYRPSDLDFVLSEAEWRDYSLTAGQEENNRNLGRKFYRARGKLVDHWAIWAISQWRRLIADGTR